MKFLLLCASLILTPSLHAQVYKCVDPKTGNVTFSGGACATGRQGATVRVNPVNSSDSTEGRRAQYQLEEQQYESQQSANRRPSNQYSNNQRQTSSDPMAEQARKDAYRAASTPHKGANGLTAGQLRTLAALGGANVSKPSREYSQNRAPSQSRVMTSCDGAGCWDNQGTRYNRGAGDTYFSSTGGSCQGVGDQMQCN